MKKLIYTKYANDRANAFAIRTDIVKDEAGTRFVRKCFWDEAGKAHVLGMYKNYEYLLNLYADYKMPVVPVACRKIDNGVEFDFAQGKSLDSVLRGYIAEKQKEQLKEALEQYLELVAFDKVDVMFETSEEFEKVFGAIGKSWEQEKAVSYANIDMIPGNIIINDKWNIIDYEWMFDFKIPLKFVQYRCLHYWYHENKGDALFTLDELLELIDVTKEQQVVFEEMERHFQTYLCEGMVPTREMRDIIGQNVVSINEVNEELLKMNPVQIFYDAGNGFNENDSCKIRKTNFKEKKINVAWEIPVDIKAIRIDPIEKSCVCEIKRLEINGKSVEFTTNGVMVSEGIYNFVTNDPWIVSSVVASEGDVLVVDIELDYDEHTCKALTQSHSKLVIMEENNVRLQGKNAHLMNENEYLLNQFEQGQMEMADKMALKQKVKNILRGKWFD